LILSLIERGVLLPNYELFGHRDKEASNLCPGKNLYAMLPLIRQPWEIPVAGNPDLHDIEGPLSFHPIVDSNGFCTGYYIFGTKTGEVHAYGDPEKVKFYGRSEDPTP
jgi:hypothetical protein